MRRFFYACLLAKSVGMIIQDSKLIDKFLLSMAPNKRYLLAVQHLLTQRRNEEMTPNYGFIKLTMTEVENHLYTDDENHTSIFGVFQAQALTSINKKSNNNY